MGGEKKAFDADLDEFVRLVSPKLPKNDLYNKGFCRRFLVAREGNLKKAETMLLESLAWRVKHKVDSVLETTPNPNIIKYIPHGFCGQTKEGHQIYVERSGAMTLPGPDVVSMDDLFHWKVWMSEKVDAIARESKGSSGKTIAVLDVQGLTLAKMTQPVLDFLKMIGEIEEKNYPESLEKVLIVNAGFVFSNVWTMVKYFFAAEVRKKIVVAGESYEKELYKLVGKEHMPNFFKGGLNASISAEEWAGDLSYMETLPKSAAHVGLESKEVVPAGKAFKKKVVTTTTNSVITWSFATEAKSIEFSLVAPSGKVIEKPKKVDSAAPTTGTHTAAEVGEYKVVFCNKFSWTTEKILRYNVTLTEPNGDSADPAFFS